MIEPKSTDVGLSVRFKNQDGAPVEGLIRSFNEHWVYVDVLPPLYNGISTIPVIRRELDWAPPSGESAASPKAKAAASVLKKHGICYEVVSPEEWRIDKMLFYPDADIAKIDGRIVANSVTQVVRIAQGEGFHVKPHTPSP